MMPSQQWGWSADPRAAATGGAPGSTPTLDDILCRTRTDLELTKQRLSVERVRRHAESRGPCRDFGAALRSAPGARPRVIAELKRASPSRGLIRADFGVLSLSRELAEHGAAALSVLTEVHYFQGSPRYLQSVAANTRLPVLRKDFIVDPYQVYEARAWGADAILLIATALEPREFARLQTLARDLGLQVLAEVHEQEELHWVLDSGAEIVGINSRDLRTFKTALERTETLLADVPAGVLAVAESGVRTRADIARLRRAGACAFLIGETLMRAPSPGLKLDELIGAAEDGGDES